MRFKTFIESVTAQNLLNLSAVQQLQRQFPHVKREDIAQGVIKLMSSDPMLQKHVGVTPNMFTLQTLDGVIKKALADKSQLDRLQGFLAPNQSAPKGPLSVYDQFLALRAGTGLTGDPASRSSNGPAPVLAKPLTKMEFEKVKTNGNPDVLTRDRLYDNGFVWKQISGLGGKGIFRWVPPSGYKFAD